LAFNGTYASDTLFELFFGMAIGFIDGFSGFAQVMEVTQLVGYEGQGMVHGFADRELPITDDRYNGHTQGLFDAAQERSQVGVGSGQQALGEEDFPGEAIPEDPQDFMPHIGL
jgi:hypothetical protein